VSDLTILHSVLHLTSAESETADIEAASGGRDEKEEEEEETENENRSRTTNPPRQAKTCYYERCSKAPLTPTA
jgi:hypothetical protein